MSCTVVGTDCKKADETIPLGFDLSSFCARIWSSLTRYDDDVTVRPDKLGTGFQYRASTAGFSGKAEPSWPIVAARTVKDGSLVWICEAVDADSLVKTISSVAWRAEEVEVMSPTEALVFSSPSVQNANGSERVGVFVSGGTAGQTYLVIAQVTFSDGHVEDFGISLEVQS